MFISEEHRIVYLAHPKTASQSTRTALQEAYGLMPCGTYHGTFFRDVFDGTQVTDDWLIMTTVRNQYDAVASWWFHINPRTEGPHPGFVKDKLMQQHPYAALHATKGEFWGLHSHDANVILRFETLEADLNRALFCHGFDRMVILPHEGAGRGRNGRHYRDLICPELRKEIEDLWAEDIERWGYAW